MRKRRSFENEQQKCENAVPLKRNSKMRKYRSFENEQQKCENVVPLKRNNKNAKVLFL